MKVCYEIKKLIFKVENFVVFAAIQFGEKGKPMEFVLDTARMVKNLLKKFLENTKFKPHAIVYYRDGVSEGQFEEVLNKELSGIQRLVFSQPEDYQNIEFFFFRACKELEDGYEPKVTFLVAQKRHKTRMFPDNPKARIS